MRWLVIYEPDAQDGFFVHHRVVHVHNTLSVNDGPTPAYFEADTANEAIGAAALALKEHGRYIAANIDTVIVADDVQLQMEAVVPGIKSMEVALGAGD